LAKLLARAENDSDFYRLLMRQCAARKPLVAPRSERAALKRLLDELS
jgi:hypothetical protein